MAITLSQGTTVQINDGSSLKTIAGIQSFSGFDGTKTEIDTTTLASTAKEFTLGLLDNGNFNLELIYDADDAGQKGLLACYRGSTARQMKVVFPSGTLKTATFNVLVTSFPLNAAVDEVVTSSVSIRITGAVVWS